MKFLQPKNNSYNTLKAWLIILFGALFYCYQFIIRVSPNVMHDDLVNNFNIDEAMFGFLIGLYYWGYSSMQLPLGIAMDKLGPRRIITFAVSICALACFIFSQTQNLVIASIARIMMGLGAASGLMGSLKLGSLWLPPRRMGIVSAVTMAFGTLGASLGGTPLKLVTNSIGWKNTYKVFSLIGIILAILIYLIVRDKPKSIKYDSGKTKKNTPSIFEGLKKILITPQVWLIALFGAFMYMPITIIGIAWGIPLLKSIYKISELKAAPIAAAMFLGAALGSPIFALLSDFFESRKVPMFIGGLCCLIIWLIIIRIPNIPMYFMYSLFFLGGFFYTAKILTFASNCETQPPSYSAVTVGFTNMIVMLTGAISHPIVGSLLEYKAKGRKIFSTEDYRFALSIVPICLIIGLFILFFIKETYPKKCYN